MAQSPNQPHSDTSTAKKAKSTWNYTPDLPVTTSPYFRWPPDFKLIGKWLLGGWFPISERSIILLLAIVSSLYFLSLIHI